MKQKSQKTEKADQQELHKSNYQGASSDLKLNADLNLDIEIQAHQPMNIMETKLLERQKRLHTKSHRSNRNSTQYHNTVYNLQKDYSGKDFGSKAGKNMDTAANDDDLQDSDNLIIESKMLTKDNEHSQSNKTSLLREDDSKKQL